MTTLLHWYLGAVALGALFAWHFVKVFQIFVPKGTSREHWGAVGRNVHGLLYGEEDRFWHYYWGIVRDSGKYVIRQLAGLALALAPLVVALVLFAPGLLAQWDRNAEYAVFPPDAAFVSRVASADELGESTPMTLELSTGNTVPLSSNPGGQVLCQPGRLACLVLQGFGFTAIEVDPEVSGTTTLIIARTDHNDWNPLWPYLSDPEFLFFASLVVASIVLLFVNRKPVEPSESGYRIGFTDNFLTQLATHSAKTMVRLGNLETKMLKRRIANVEIDRPIFICGLARSGTTMLLEKLASLDGVATHRYRDFPFIMTPVWWNRILSLFATHQDPIERPHQDGIQITRDSPDAFEEPIWKYFFPYVHDATRSHVLDASVDNPEFHLFYADHIKKILRIRNGQRYLAKGNYNLTRIAHIKHLFPTARFLLPIRHPLTHITSLVRQHELFVKYANNEPAVSDYLRAAGHYEFGPQRIPIVITPATGMAILTAWDRGDNFLGYAVQWASIYQYVLDLLSALPAIRDAVLVVRYEDLCRSPVEEFNTILDFCELNRSVSSEFHTTPVARFPGKRLPDDALIDACWTTVAAVAQAYGYERNPHIIV